MKLCSLLYSTLDTLSLPRAKKKLEFQHALCNSQMLLALSKTWFTFFYYLLGRRLAWALALWEVKMKSYLPSRKIYLSELTGWFFSWTLSTLLFSEVPSLSFSMLLMSFLCFCPLLVQLRHSSNILSKSRKILLEVTIPHLWRYMARSQQCFIVLLVKHVNEKYPFHTPTVNSDYQCM